MTQAALEPLTADTASERVPRVPVLIVDDHEVVHWGFRLQLSREAWVERCLGARDGAEAVALTERYEPQVALIDLILGQESGAEVCTRIREVAPGTRVLLMSGTGRMTERTVRSVGAAGFVSKDAPMEKLIAALRSVAQGQTAFAPVSSEAPSTPLTEREGHVLNLLVTGATNREIAAVIHLSRHTVKEHVSSLYRKLGARNRADAVHRAQQFGLIG